MPDIKSVSFRAQTTGHVSDFLLAEKMADASLQNLLVYLAGALLNYREEGVEFSPTIMICNDLNGVLRTFPGPVSYRIGTVPFQVQSGAKILKDCAPLSGSNWSIYLEQKGDQLDFGMFSYFRSPTAVTLHDSMTLLEKMSAILVRRINPNTIEMRGTKGSVVSFMFSTTLDAIDDKPSIAKFAATCISDLPESEARKDFERYFCRLLEGALTNSHGTILVCSQLPDMGSIPSMKDAVPLSPTLNFYDVFTNYQRDSSADAILNLQRCEDLLLGFLRCDGIVAFDTKGQIRAYRVFFKPVGDGAEDASEVVGGARRRAFEGLKKLGKQHLLCTLFRSQDGTTLHYEAV